MVRIERPLGLDGRSLLLYGLSALGLVFLAALLIPPHGYDLFAFWHANVDYANLTDFTGQGGFRYAPAIALGLAPLSALPWEAVEAVWLTVQLLALWYIGGRWALALVVFPPVWLDLVYGNINILLAAVIVAGFRHPAVWSVALLTKVTPGVGIAWFAVRREWRSLALIAATTAAVVAVSAVIQGVEAWQAWFGLLAATGSMSTPDDALAVPLVLRVPIALLIVAVAGLTDRRWLVPVGVVLAMPTLWAIAFAPLIAIAGIRHRQPLATHPLWPGSEHEPAWSAVHDVVLE